MQNPYTSICNIESITIIDVLRAGLTILEALGKFNSSGPPRAIHAEAILHYSTIHKQHINTRLCMHANSYSINIVCTKHGKLLLNVYIVVSAGYSMCYHITMKVCWNCNLYT